MTFLNSLLNNLSDVDEQYRNEHKLWCNFKFLKTFNRRECKCISDYEFSLEFDNYNYDDEIYDELDNNPVCKCDYPNPEQCLTKDNYTLILPKLNEDYIVKLNREQILLVMKYMKDKGVPIIYSDLIYEKDTNSNKNKHKICEWNMEIIKLYNLSDSDIRKFMSEYNTSSCLRYGLNYNVLRIMSGLGGLKYSN